MHMWWYMIARLDAILRMFQYDNGVQTKHGRRFKAGGFVEYVMTCYEWLTLVFFKSTAGFALSLQIGWWKGGWPWEWCLCVLLVAVHHAVFPFETRRRKTGVPSIPAFWNMMEYVITTVQRFSLSHRFPSNVSVPMGNACCLIARLLLPWWPTAFACCLTCLLTILTRGVPIGNFPLPKHVLVSFRSSSKHGVPCEKTKCIKMLWFCRDLVLARCPMINCCPGPFCNDFHFQL